MEQKVGLDSLFKKAYSVLKEKRIPHLLIGGLVIEKCKISNAKLLLFTDNFEMKSITHYIMRRAESLKA